MTRPSIASDGSLKFTLNGFLVSITLKLIPDFYFFVRHAIGGEVVISNPNVQFNRADLTFVSLIIGPQQEHTKGVWQLFQKVPHILST